MSLQADIVKCKFYVTEINYLKLIISINGICINLKKVEAIQNWETPTCVKDIQTFIRFANFYCCFIKKFSNIIGPMINAIKKDKAFYWFIDCQKLFELLKKQFTTTLILAHFDFETEYIVEIVETNQTMSLPK